MTTVLLLINLIFTPAPHVGQVAEYYYTLENNELLLKFVVEKEEVMNFELKNCEMQEMTTRCISNYILKNSEFALNGKTLELEMGDSYVENGHLVIYFNAKVEDSNVKEVKVKNGYFYEFDRNYKNRIILNVGPHRGSYLLSKGREEILLN